jgi:hypothetical protein
MKSKMSDWIESLRPEDTTAGATNRLELVSVAAVLDNVLVSPMSVYDEACSDDRYCVIHFGTRIPD